jgi:Na+-transporting NADH:ubiquinone oxidoreductase subunit C
MRKDSPGKAILVVSLTALICSTLVSAAVVVFRPIQLNNQLLERSRNIMQLTGLLAEEPLPDDDEMLALFKSLDSRLIEIDPGHFSDAMDPRTFDDRKAANDPDLGVPIPAQQDLANLGRRSRFKPAYLVWEGDALSRIILPVHGAGMWSTLYGYIALEPDLNTIAGMIFYEQNETPGLGDQILHEHWQQQWRGREIFDDRGVPVFRVGEGAVAEGSEAARHQVDAITGATVTGNAVTALIGYWFGPHGYGAFLDDVREHPPVRPEGDG